MEATTPATGDQAGDLIAKIFLAAFVAVFVAGVAFTVAFDLSERRWKQRCIEEDGTYATQGDGIIVCRDRGGNVIDTF